MDRVRNAAIAMRLAHEGKAAAKSDLELALRKFLNSLDFDDTNAGTYWELSRLYEKKGDWWSVKETLVRATELEPRVAHYRYHLGYAWIQLGKAGDADAYEQAREPLTKCHELDPQLTDCSFWLGFVEEWTDHPAAAAEHYRDAISRGGTDPKHALALAALYRVFHHDLEAETVLADAARVVQPSAYDPDDAARFFLAWARLALTRRDFATTQAALSRITAPLNQMAPELLFDAGALYATPAPQHPLDETRAVSLLVAFFKRACRGSEAAHFQGQCDAAQAMMQRLSAKAMPSQLPSAPGPAALPDLPPPQLTLPTIKSGDAFTVAGASYFLRAPQHQAEVLDKRLSVTGYITKTNLGDAPRCAVHTAGKADPDNCFAALPQFWLGDTPDAPPENCVQVLGWASNYAQIYDAIHEFDRGQPEYLDSLWGQPVPNPLPAAGAKVTVQGEYSLAFRKASAGEVADDVMGILSYETMQQLEPSLELATLPGVKRKR